jgi:hypothetical protein
MALQTQNTRSDESEIIFSKNYRNENNSTSLRVILDFKNHSF